MAAAPDQVLRNQSVGSRCSTAGSGPRLAAVIAISMSFGPALAYSTAHVEVAVVVEDARVGQLELRLVPARAADSPRPAAA